MSDDSPPRTHATGLAELERLALSLVGTGKVGEAQHLLTRAMLSEALKRTAGNYTRAAALLGVRRQAVQQMVTRFNLEPWARSLRAPASERPLTQRA
jgi:transcriptional regulator with GAF, ATPase, and Fis domain